MFLMGCAGRTAEAGGRQVAHRMHPWHVLVRMTPGPYRVRCNLQCDPEGLICRLMRSQFYTFQVRKCISGGKNSESEEQTW